MKLKIQQIACAFGIAALCFGCAPKPEKTIENLKAAVTGETGANAKYALYAQAAVDSGYVNIGKMFTAASAAEAVHIKNHQAVLAKLGVKDFTATPESVIPGTTEANLQDAIKGETYESTTMYPGFLEIAKTEKSADAVKTFTWANDAEKRHAQLYTSTLNSLTADGNDSNVSSTWYVCPKCGNLYNSITGVESCEFCGTKSSVFEKF